MKRKIWKTDVIGIGPYVVEDALEIIATPRSVKDAQEIANIPEMITALEATLDYLSENPAVLKHSREDLQDIIGGSLAYQEI